MIEEIVADAFESAIDDEALEEETEREVNKVLSEIATEIKNLPAAKRPVSTQLSMGFRTIVF